MTSGPVCAMVLEGLDAVRVGRTIIGALPSRAAFVVALRV